MSELHSMSYGCLIFKNKWMTINYSALIRFILSLKLQKVVKLIQKRQCWRDPRSRSQRPSIPSSFRDYIILLFQHFKQSKSS